MTSRPSNNVRLLVVTGDHQIGDATKWGGGYSEDDLELHRQMCAAVASLPGYAVEVWTDHGRLLERLQSDPPDLVLNFCDTGLGNVATRELLVPAILDVLGIPYTGSGAAAMVLCYDKAIVRLLADTLRVPTPNEVYVPPSQTVDGALGELDGAYPALIKPSQGDGSVGIGRDAVVASDAEAREVLTRFRQQFPGRSALLQEYLPGPEYGLALVGNPGDGFVAFPPLEVDFSALDPSLPPILAFESKTGPDDAYSAVRVVRAELSKAKQRELRTSAELLFDRLECRDYARFDFRTAADGVIKLMEVNPNPAWSAAAKLALMAGFGGKTYTELLAMILDSARARLAGKNGGPPASITPAKQPQRLRAEASCRADS